jgi:hypothetical protein
MANILTQKCGEANSTQRLFKDSSPKGQENRRKGGRKKPSRTKRKRKKAEASSQSRVGVHGKAREYNISNDSTQMWKEGKQELALGLLGREVAVLECLRPGESRNFKHDIAIRSNKCTTVVAFPDKLH